MAHDEAGHCVAAYRLRIPFTGRKALIIIHTEAYTYSGCFIRRCILKNDVEWDASDHNRLKMERRVQALLAVILSFRLIAFSRSFSIRCRMWKSIPLISKLESEQS